MRKLNVLCVTVLLGGLLALAPLASASMFHMQHHHHHHGHQHSKTHMK